MFKSELAKGEGKPGDSQHEVREDNDRAIPKGSDYACSDDQSLHQAYKSTGPVPEIFSSPLDLRRLIQDLHPLSIGCHVLNYLPEGPGDPF